MYVMSMSEIEKILKLILFAFCQYTKHENELALTSAFVAGI